MVPLTCLFGCLGPRPFVWGCTSTVKVFLCGGPVNFKENVLCFKSQLDTTARSNSIAVHRTLPFFISLYSGVAVIWSTLLTVHSVAVQWFGPQWWNNNSYYGCVFNSNYVISWLDLLGVLLVYRSDCWSHALKRGGCCTMLLLVVSMGFLWLGISFGVWGVCFHSLYQAL